ncbi:MAG: VOC family protein, partial [Nitrosopumilales archaeon CG15_BIG_FIL_POST_REV_8_21_14_020_33_23]
AIAHFGFHVENFDEIMKICTSLGVKIYYDGPVQFEKSRSIYISDPNGYDIELSEVFGGGL